MAKSPILRVLFASRLDAVTGQRLPWHAHPYWQCERVERGMLALHHPDGIARLGRGMAVLIPPGVPHALHFEAPTASTTVKFHAPERLPGVRILGLDSPAAEVATLLHRQALAGIAASTPGLLMAVLACAAGEAAAHVAPRGLVDVIKRVVDASYQMGQAPVRGVADCARRAGYSVSHCAGAFRAATGTSLKAWIDAQRADQAERLLRYGDQDLGEVARLLTFPDANAFSRFFRRVRGEAPGRWRRRQARRISPER